jgi:soluble lytic murein transglycosylase-like protein
MQPVRFALAILVVSVMSLAGFHSRPLPALTPSIQQEASAVLRDPRFLSDMDRALYTAIFEAESRGDHDTADTLISQLDNQLLLGQILGDRYLTENYDTNAPELALWLQNYGDHPQAGRIAALARKKGVDSATISQHATLTAPLKGDGYVFHLGRSTMPGEWYRGLRLWKEHNYSKAAQAFRQVGDNEDLNRWQRAAGNYWAYRSLLGMRDTRAANRELAKAASYPLTFYGQLALARQGENLPVRAKAPEVASDVRNNPQALRAAAFHAIGMNDKAETELRSLYTRLDEKDRPAVVALAAEFDLPNLQVRLARMPALAANEALFAQYPMPSDMIRASEDIIAPALVLAVARHESAFRDSVKSPAGAQGTMQMLPSTAQHVVKRNETTVALADNMGGALTIGDRLNDSGLSAELGANYLRMLTKEKAIGANLMKILAGYNAGPGAVANWNKTASRMNDPLLYLESIPYTETRNYVMQVMAHYWIYQNMMGERSASLNQLARGVWPTV